MKLKRDFNYALPYALHDAYISNMHYHQGTLTLDFDQGFYDIGRDCAVGGSVYFDSIDPAFSEVLVYKRKGNKVKGKVMSLKKFIKKYGEEELQLIDEYYDDDSAKYGGTILCDDDMLYFEMNIIILGDMYYLLDANDLDEEEDSEEGQDDEVEEDENNEDADDDEEDGDVAETLEDIEEALDHLEKKELPWAERVLVKNTTFEQRRKIVEDSLGGDVTCAGDDVIAEMYNDYIDGKIELADINREYMKMMGGE